MKKNLLPIILFFSMIVTSCLSTLQLIEYDLFPEYSSNRVPAYTNDEAISALKDALVEGIKSASVSMSKENAYYNNSLYKILLPKEAQPIMKVLYAIPGGKVLAEDVVLRLNRTAETAAKDTVSIFSSAIKSMTVVDGIKIVTGNKNAATQYLKEKCYSKLIGLYKPKISTVLNKPLVLNVSANTAWTNLVTNYNKYAAVPNSIAIIAGKEPPCPEVEVDLATYATEKALDGLFAMIEKEEANIRANPLEYSSKMIQKVFGYVKRGITTIAQ